MVEIKGGEFYMKKSYIIILVVVICLIGVLGTIFFLNRGNNKQLSILEEIRFNEGEEEILEVLKGANDWLLSEEEEQQEENDDDTLFSINPKPAPIALRDFITKIYEVRRKKTDNGEPYYILDVDTKSEEKVTRRFCIYSKSKLIIGLANSDFDWSEFGEEKVEETRNDEGGISYTFSFGASFYQAMLESWNQQIQEEWNNAEKFNYVNYNALLKAI